MNEKKKFNNILRSFMRKKRVMPWRETKDPYRILVSEIMLQQTQVSRVIPKYKAFIKRFPTVVALSKASQKEVLIMWQGLGYNRRALFLQKAVQKIQKRGVFPKTREELVSLPGIGDSTAGGILAYAFDIPTPFIETNIRRIFIKHFFSKKEKVNDREILEILKEILPKKGVRAWYWACMDYGTFLAEEEKVNPNRKSKHYVKQTPLKGSVREIRGRIIRELSGKDSNLLKLKKEFGKKREGQWREALQKLIKEKMIIRKGRGYALV